MGFPVKSVTQYVGGSAATHNVPIPAVSVGDRVIVLFNTDNAPVPTWDAIWTTLTTVGTAYDGIDYAGNSRCSGRYRDIDGTEGWGSGGTTAISLSAADDASAIIIVLDAGTFDSAETPEVNGASAGSSSSAPNPQSLTPSWGAADTLWIATCSWDGTVDLSTYPTDYVDGVWNDAVGNGNAAAFRELNAASEDPGAFALTSAESTRAATIAVKGAAAGGSPHPLAAAITATGTVAADLQIGMQFAAAVTATATTAADLQTGVHLEAAATATATVTGELFLPLALFEAAITAEATTNATLSPGANLSAAATGTATTAASLSIGVNFTSAISGTVTVSADLTAIAGHQAQLVFRLYPRSDPKNGALLVEFSQLKAAEFRREANGTGAGRIVLAGDSDDAQFIDPRGMQYIRVYALMQDASEVLLGGFFLETGDYDALTGRGTKDLSFAGAGTLSYLGRAVMWNESFLTEAGYVSDPVDDLWRLSEADSATPLGTVFWILIRELQEAARPQAPIPAVTIDFDEASDSDSTAWSQLAGEMTARVKENVLAGPVKQLMERGLYVDMDGDFGLHAYEPGTFGRDLTGLAWGANVVRFQAPTDGTQATGNIKADARRAISGPVKRSVILVGADDVYEAVEDVAADIVWEGSYDSEAKESTALTAIGTAQLAARADADDVVQLRIRHGDNPEDGYYIPTPGGHVWLNDTVTLHTGTGDWDWNESEQRVAAISWKMGTAGDWDVWVEFGSVFHPAAVRVQQARDRSVDNITHLTRRVAALQTAGANQLPDSSFEASTAAAWAVGTGWTHGYASAAAFRGTSTARLLRSNASAGVLRSADFIPISRIDQYHISAWSFLTSIGANVEAEFYVEEYNAASTLLATTVIAELTAAETLWTRHSAKFGPTAALGRNAWQATTTKVKVGFRTAGTDSTPTITWEVDGVQVERGNLMTAYAPMPEELYNVPGEVIIDENGVTIVNGALTVKNPGGTVIIDGTSDHFRIVANGSHTYSGVDGSVNYASAVRTVDVMTGLLYQPVLFAWISASGAQIMPQVILNSSSATKGLVWDQQSARSSTIAGGTRVNIITEAFRNTSGFSYTVRYMISDLQAF